MSEYAMLRAVRDKLRSSLNYQTHECMIDLDNSTPAIAGQVYVGVSSANWISEYSESLSEIFDVDVAIYLKAQVSPRSDYEPLWRDMDRRMREIITKLHLQWDVMNAANALIPGDSSTVSKFCVPLRYARANKSMELLDGSHFGSQPDKALGMKRVLHFVGAQRVQYLTAMT